MHSPFTVEFIHGGIRKTTSSGQRFSSPRQEGFRDTPSRDLNSLVADVRAGHPWRDVIESRFAASNPWLHRIVADPSRIAFFEAVLPKGDGLAMDLGSGWGQIARPLAHDRQVVAVEPIAERLAFIEESARQEGVHPNIAFIEADYMEISFRTQFAAICAIGVLEWVGTFQKEFDAQECQQRFLKKIRAELAAGGHLILGIENRIGLKYLLGCPDDHIGVSGIACLPAEIARARWHASSGHELKCFTYSPSELRELLRTAGFRDIEFFAAFPDYKLPKLILPFGEDGQQINSWLSSHQPPPEHNGYNGSALTPDFSEALNAHYRTLALEGAAHSFVPSFFVRAS